MSSSSHKRGRKFLWILGALLTFVALIAVGHFAWSRYERRQLLADIRQLQQAGEPILPEDFNASSGEIAGNPVPEWRAAAAAVNTTLVRDWLDPMRRAEVQLPLTPREAAALAKVVQGNQPVLLHTRAAAGMTGKPDWQLHFPSPAYGLLLPDLGQQRTVAEILCAAALEAHQRGDDAAAVEFVCQLLALQRAVFCQPVMVGHLVALGIGSLDDDTIQQIAPDLRIGTFSDSASRPARPDQIRLLIHELLDETAQRDGQKYALRTQRMCQVDAATEVAEGKISLAAVTQFRPGGAPTNGVGGYFLSPLLYADGRIVLRQTTKAIDAALAPDWPSSQVKLQSLIDHSRLNGSQHFLASMLLPSFDRMIQQDFRLMADHRLCAIQLAARWYAIDHDGRQPPSLDDLAPRYLATIPLDPMTQGSRLHYRPGPDPIIYSAGTNGIDDGGSEQPIDPSRSTDNRWERKDVVTHLLRQPRTDNVDETDASIFPDDATPPAQGQPATAPATSG